VVEKRDRAGVRMQGLLGLDSKGEAKACGDSGEAGDGELTRDRGKEGFRVCRRKRSEVEVGTWVGFLGLGP
jgi:hypothetical protein